TRGVVPEQGRIVVVAVSVAVPLPEKVNVYVSPPRIPKPVEIGPLTVIGPPDVPTVTVMPAGAISHIVSVVMAVTEKFEPTLTAVEVEPAAWTRVGFGRVAKAKNDAISMAMTNRRRDITDLHVSALYDSA